MALKIAQEYFDSGVTLEYWRLISFEVNLRDNKIKVVFGGYVSKEARDSGKMPLTNALKKFQWEWGTGSFTHEAISAGSIVDSIYNKAKESVMSPVMTVGVAPHETNIFVNAEDI